MACIVEPQELILEQTIVYVFCLFLSPLWSDGLFFEKSDFYKNYNKICKILIFFFVKFVLKKWDKNFFSHFSRPDSI